MSKILVVDDERAITDFVREALVEEGYRVDVCHDGGAALRQIQVDPPDLVLLDIGLPVVSGDVVLREVRARGQIHLPIIVATATTNVEQFITAGATAILRKPFTLDKLIDAVAAHLPKERAAGGVNSRAA